MGSDVEERRFSARKPRQQMRGSAPVVAIPTRVPCESQPLLRASAFASHPRRSLSAGMLENKGLISRIAVPSSISTPRTCNSLPSRRSSSTIVKAIGFGRRGDRVANTPCGRLSEGGVPSSSNPCARSNSQRTIKCEKPSMSVSPDLKLRQDLKHAIRLVPSAKPLGNLARVLVRTTHKSNRPRCKHLKNVSISRKHLSRKATAFISHFHSPV